MFAKHLVEKMIDGHIYRLGPIYEYAAFALIRLDYFRIIVL